jgi:multidrug transporter EmrE-like cation transporter
MTRPVTSLASDSSNVRGIVFIGYVVVYAVVNAGGLLLLRSSLSGHELRSGIGKLVTDGRFIAGVCLYALGFAMWLATLTRYQLSVVYPIFVGVGYCSVVLAAFLFLNEGASTTKLIGVSLVGIGLLFVIR